MTERLPSTLGASCKAGAGARSCPTSQKGRGATVWDEHGELRPAVWPAPSPRERYIPAAAMSIPGWRRRNEDTTTEVRSRSREKSLFL